MKMRCLRKIVGISYSEHNVINKETVRQTTDTHTGPYRELLITLSKNETAVVRLCNKIGRRRPAIAVLQGTLEGKRKPRTNNNIPTSKKTSSSHVMLRGVFVLPICR